MKTIATIIAALAISASAFAQSSGQWIEAKRYSASITAGQALTAYNWATGILTCSQDDAAATRTLHMYLATNAETGASEIRLSLDGLKTYTDASQFPKGKRIVSRDVSDDPQERVHCAGTVTNQQAATAAAWGKALVGYGGADADVKEIKIVNKGGSITLKLIGLLYHDAADFPLNTPLQGRVP